MNNVIELVPVKERIAKSIDYKTDIGTLNREIINTTIEAELKNNTSDIAKEYRRMVIQKPITNLPTPPTATPNTGNIRQDTSIAPTPLAHTPGSPPPNSRATYAPAPGLNCPPPSRVIPFLPTSESVDPSSAPAGLQYKMEKKSITIFNQRVRMFKGVVADELERMSVDLDSEIFRFKQQYLKTLNSALTDEEDARKAIQKAKIAKEAEDKKAAEAARVLAEKNKPKTPATTTEAKEDGENTPPQKGGEADASTAPLQTHEEVNTAIKKTLSELQGIVFSQRAGRSLVNVTKTLIKAIITIYVRYYTLHYNFFYKEIKGVYEYLRHWEKVIHQRKLHYKLHYVPPTDPSEMQSGGEQQAQQGGAGKKAGEYTEYDAELAQIKEAHKTMENLANIANAFLSKVELQDPEDKRVLQPLFDRIHNSVKGSISIVMQNKASVADYPHIDKAFSGCFTKHDAARSAIQAKLSKLYYINEPSIMDIIMDSKFIAMYVLKIIHFLIFIGAMFLTEKVFSEMYMKKVYAENTDPPNLLAMLGVLVAIDIGFVLFLVTIMFLLQYIFKRPANNFIISIDLITTFIKDLFAFLVLFVVLALMIGYIIQKKRYFRYKTEGLRGIRAYKEMMIGIAAILVLIPYFLAF